MPIMRVKVRERRRREREINFLSLRLRVIISGGINLAWALAFDERLGWMHGMGRFGTLISRRDFLVFREW
jgi:hypothetical protein